MLGYIGKLLIVNLTNGKIEKKEIDQDLLHKTLGGRALGAQLMYDLCPPNKDPLDPEIPFMVLTGPVSGTPVLGACKHAVITKSPSTGGWLDTYASGHMVSHLKYAGYDGLVVIGKSEKPCYLAIDDDKVEIRDASNLWGRMDAFETEEWLRKHFNERGGKMCIGPAAENCIRFACINSDFYRQTGRGGAGAVMGSKNLKAIAVFGTGGIKVADMKGLLDKLQEAKKMIQESAMAATWAKFGTFNVCNIANSGGMLPTRNFQTSIMPEATGKIDKDGLLKVKVGDHACPGCMMPCANLTEVKDGPYKGTRLEGPDYETISCLGTNVGIADHTFISVANILCDRLGLDTMSTGVIIGFAMECYEKGLLTKKDTDGLDLRFGNAEAALEAIRKIAHLDGFGAFLAQGVKKMAEKIGQGSEKFSFHVKGLEFPGYDPRGTFGGGLNFAVNPRGACHRKAWPPGIEFLPGRNQFTVEGKAKIVKGIYDGRAALQNLIVCDYHSGMVPIPLPHYAEVLSLVTGEQFDWNRLLWIQERTESLIRMFNNREGFTSEDDSMPDRVLEEPLPEGPAKGQFIPREDFKRMVSEYYELRGWDENGFPTEDTMNTYALKS